MLNISETVRNTDIHVAQGSTISGQLFTVGTLSSDIASRQRLRSASCRQLYVPRHYRSKFGRRAFSVAGPVVWNSLPAHLRDLSLSSDSFKPALKTHLFMEHQ